MTPPEVAAAQLLSREEVGRRLAVSPRMVTLLISRGDLAVTRIGKRTLVSVAELDRFIADHTK